VAVPGSFAAAAAGLRAGTSSVAVEAQLVVGIANQTVKIQGILVVVAVVANNYSVVVEAEGVG